MLYDQTVSVKYIEGENFKALATFMDFFSVNFR